MDRRQALGGICCVALAGLAVPAFAETSDAAFDVLLGRYVVADPDGVMCGRRPRCKRNLTWLLAVGCKSCVRPVVAVQDRWP